MQTGRFLFNFFFLELVYLFVCRPDNQYRCPVSRRTSCDLLPYHVPSGAFNPGRNLTEGESLFIGLDKNGYQVKNFLTFQRKHMLWYSLEVPRQGASNEYPQHMCLLRNKKNKDIF